MAVGSLVLIVDDDADIREGLSEFLTDEGFEVVTAANGQDAMEWLCDRRPAACVILLDLMMPVMDGRTFLRAKQLKADLAMLPVIIITAGRSEVELTPDICKHISKPIELPHLVAAIADCP